MSTPPTTIDTTSAALVLIDVQPLFLDGMHGTRAPLVTRLQHLLALAQQVSLPCLATFEEPVDVKGWLPDTLEPLFPASGQRYRKQFYNCCGEPEIREALQQLAVRQLIVAGAETDVCVLQSVLGMLEMGFQVFLLEDCLFTTEPHPRPALRRMEAAGAISLTLKTLYYEIKQSTAVPKYHIEWNEQFADTGIRFMSCEDLPVWEPQR